MPDAPRCSRCGAALPTGTLAGVCPACLLQLGLDTAATEMSRPSDGAEAATNLADPSNPARATKRAGTATQPDQIGPYRLARPLGEGGMGVVYLAEQSEPIKRTVALKLIKLGMDTHEVVVRFEAERQALALMDHPSIASVLAAGATPDGRPYFVMEYVPGMPLTEHCDQHHDVGTGSQPLLQLRIT